MSRTTWIRDASGKSVGYIDDIGTRQTLKKNNAAGTMVGYFDGKATYQNNKGSITKLGDELVYVLSS